MRTSKAVFIRWMMALNLLMLAGCTLPESKDRKDIENSVATFQVDSVKGSVLESRIENNFGLSDSKVFSFQVCIKDVNEKKSIGGQTFKVEETNQNAVTDAGGCINWTESLTYNPLADSRYVKIKRTLSGTGLHRGSKVLQLAINPWNNGENIAPVLDLSKENVPSLTTDATEVQNVLKGLNLKTGKMVQRPLWIEDGRVFITEDRITADGKINLKVEMRIVPTIQVKKTSGDTYARPLSRGTFKARAVMIHSYVHQGKETRVLLGTSEDAEYKMINSSLGMKFIIPAAAVPDRGQVLLGLHLEPVDGPTSMTPFEGVFMLGEYDQMKASTFLRVHSVVSETPNFTLAGFVQNDIANVLSLRNDDRMTDDVYRKAKIEVEPLRLPFQRIGKESTSRREVIYRINACIKHGVDQKNVRSHNFKITKFKADGDTATPEVVERRTLNDACFNWQESIEVDVNQCQHYIRGKVVISNEDLGMNEVIPVMINPWDTMASEIGRDMRYVNKDETVAFDCKDEGGRPRRQIKLEQITFLQSSSSYELDNALNLTYVKHYEVRMDAWSLSYSHLFGGRDDARMKLRDGVYLLRTAIVRNKDYDSENTFVASAEKLVNVVNGQVNTRLEFRTKDLKAVGNRNTLLVDISPVKETLLSQEPDKQGNPLPAKPGTYLSNLIDMETPIDSPVFQGNIVLHTDETTRTLSPYDNSTLTKFLLKGHGEIDSRQNGLIEQIVANGKLQMKDAAAASAAKNTVQYFAQANNLELVNINANVADPIRAATKVTTFAGGPDDAMTANLKISSSDLQSILSSGKISTDVSAKLCNFWLNDYFAKFYAEKGGLSYRNYRAAMANECMIQVRKNPESFFKLDRHLSVKEISGYEYVGGLNEGLSLGTGFSLSNQHSKAESVSHSIAAKGGLSAKALNLFSVGLDYAYNLSWNQSNSYSNGNTISVSTSKSMSVGMNMFNVTFSKYQLCAVVRLNPDLFIEDDSIYFFNRRTNLQKFLNTRLTGEEMGSAVTRGLMLCESQVRTKPITKSENYYVISQEGYVQAQDTGDARNRNFFLALRSDNDFLRFVTAVKGTTSIPMTSKSSDHLTADATNILQRLFHTAAPSAPGMYLLKD